VTLEQLKVLCAIVDKGSFRAAAQTLHRSQSAVSIAIRNLEEELSVNLFNRDEYRAALTDQGRSLYQKAQRVLSQADEFSALAKNYSMGDEPKLSLAISAAAPLEEIMGILKIVTQEAPATTLTLLVENLNGPVERLMDDDADIAIAESYRNPISGYENVEIARISFVPVVSAGSPLAALASTLTEADMEDQTQIVVRDTSRHIEKVTGGILKSNANWFVNDFIMKKRIISLGMGWGRLPTHLVQDEIKNGTLIVLNSAEFQPLSFGVQMIRKKNKIYGPVASRLWDLLQHMSQDQSENQPSNKSGIGTKS